MDPAKLLHGLSFSVAGATETSEVLALRRTVYTAALNNEGVDSFDTTADHLMARGPDGTIVAAFRLLGPEQRPFPIEGFVDIDKLLLGARTPAYLDRFVIREDQRTISSRQFIPLGMLKLAILRARQRAITDFLILSLPHLRSLYRSAFFRPFAEAFKHPVWGEVYPMHLDILAIERVHSERHPTLVRFLFETSSAGFPG
ncbi:GNAT family N-acetyltransferase [Candidatus Binatia bacterium]|nr:GNAT family N-acetyltransferase [Candidatus Binatia bacterium]